MTQPFRKPDPDDIKAVKAKASYVDFTEVKQDGTTLEWKEGPLFTRFMKNEKWLGKKGLAVAALAISAVYSLHKMRRK